MLTKGARVYANYRPVTGIIIHDDRYPAWVWVKWDDGIKDRHPRALLRPVTHQSGGIL